MADKPKDTPAAAEMCGENCAQSEEVILTPCRHCGRKFKEASLLKHENVCESVFLKKRPSFNDTEQRTKGFDKPDSAKEISEGILKKKGLVRAKTMKVGVRSTDVFAGTRAPVDEKEEAPAASTSGLRRAATVANKRYDAYDVPIDIIA